MRKSKNVGVWLGIGVVGLIAILVALTYGNLQFARQNPGGNDFLVHWVGTRALMVDGISPYSDVTALRIQTMVYGRAASLSEHELRVAYPLYSVALFFPFALISDFTMARAIWMTALEVSLILLALMCIQVVRWKPKLITLAVFILFSVLWYHALRPLINGNAVIVVAVMLVGALLAIRRGADELAGVLLAFTTIKPQLVILPLAFLFIWAVASRRGRLIAWLLGTLLLLVLAGIFLIPDWMLQNLREIIRYPSYNPAGTPGMAFKEWLPGVGERLGWAVSALMAFLLITSWWRARRAEFNELLWTVCLTLAVAPLTGIQNDPGNYIMLFPALVLVFATWEARWGQAGRSLTLVTILILMVGLWALFIATVTYTYQPVQSPVMIFPLPIVAILMLYWVRWWAIRPPKTWFEELQER